MQELIIRAWKPFRSCSLFGIISAFRSPPSLGSGACFRRCDSAFANQAMAPQRSKATAATSTDARARCCRRRRAARVVIVGAGIAGLSAANRLQSAAGDPPFELAVLEAGDRIGGRILSCEYDGQRVELGATWIHGVEGSPVHQIAESSGALKGSIPWERMDGFPSDPIVRAEGGLVVDRVVHEPITEMFRKLLSAAEEAGASECVQRADKGESDVRNAVSLGGFLRRGLREFFQAQEKANSNPCLLSASCFAGEVALHEACEQSEANKLLERFPLGWDLHSLQESVFTAHENLERAIRAADSLYDVDLGSFGEYLEFPGEQITIPQGFSSVVDALFDSLPVGTVKFGRKVEKISWTDSNLGTDGPPVVLICSDGSTFEADHVIITVSLGVLKDGVGVHSNCSIGGNSSESEINFSAKGMSNFDSFAENIESHNEEIEKYHYASGNLFQPPLPQHKVESIRRLGFGVVDKLFLQMEPVEGKPGHPYLQFVHRKHDGIESAAEAAVPGWMRKTFALYPTNNNSNILGTWLAGKEALEMESMTEEQIKKGILKTLTSFGYTLSNNKLTELNIKPSESEESMILSKEFMEIQEDAPIISIKRSTWGKDPLFRGSYSYVAVGSSGLDIDALAEPLPHASQSNGAPPLQLLFAGEATHRSYYSTTHGAYLSGLREADRLIQHYDFPLKS